ncbi:uncharacterized protein TRIADDRAFT_54171 [Trichoplax adhaerens]|uniref:Armadillo repeat-containing protein 8 n=1 Tax=Trichoplax adhaerens TaxID=10228 RepID=B3RRB1_TRIAD|nr:hypothetical protein TRIADDRAFT_54171 [Trichoplax adhaerens]EDV26312.1 hypothetical protein TRIADDRAFT_54171 [Trichoplax adhaerens]|eukprot:XP_002110308.1 hypothetical protein TRIADDRAFT_54171 [Trichoplax adhaerens]
MRIVIHHHNKNNRKLFNNTGEKEKHQAQIDNLFSSSIEERKATVVDIKNVVIGDVTKKVAYVDLGIIPRLLHLMVQDNDCKWIIIESTIILGSLSKERQIMEKILQTQALPIVIKGLFHDDHDVVTASLRTLRNFYLSDLTPSEPLYEENSAGIIKLLQLLSRSRVHSEYATLILSNCCRNSEQQVILFSANAVDILKPLLEYKSEKILAPTLSCFATLAYKNGTIAEIIAKTEESGKTLVEIFGGMISRDKSLYLQFLAAKCLTYLCRTGVISSDRVLIRLKVMPTLARMCKGDNPPRIQYLAADILSYLLEDDQELQELAMYTNHLLRSISRYLKRTELDPDTFSYMKQGAFHVFAALCAHSETSRKKVTEIEPHIIKHVVRGLEDSNYKVKHAAANCLLSFSRSVQQLRTNLSDNEVWKPVWKILNEDKNISEELLTILSAVICNLVLDFSPARKSLLKVPILKFLSTLAQHESKSIQLNALWAYMDADFIMGLHGCNIVAALRSIILSNDYDKEILEQTLCVVLNMASAGVATKELMAADDDLLKAILTLMSCEKSGIQLAACRVVSNLISNMHEGASSRRHKLSELGIQKTLQSLISSCSDSNLFDM